MVLLPPLLLLLTADATAAATAAAAGTWKKSDCLNAPVKGDEDRDLSEGGQAAGQRVDVLRLVQLLDRLVSRLGVVRVPRLQLLHL